jgi:soluble lytic murein transglycosylase-like protein
MNIYNWLKQTKKELIYLLILIILLAGLANYLHSNDSEEQKESTNSNEIVVSNKLIQKEYVYSNMDKNTVKIASVDETVTAESADQIEFPYYDSISLSEEVQQFTWEMANEYQVSYELPLAIMDVESDYTSDITSVTNDYGIMQLNTNPNRYYEGGTMEWAAENIGKESEFDPYNPYHNIEAGIWYISWLRDYWLNRGYSEEDTYMLVIMSYNLGIGSMDEYLHKYGLVPNDYFKKVDRIKTNLEMEGGVQDS